MTDGKTEKYKTFVTTGQAVAITGLCSFTIRKYADAKQIQCFVTPSGQRRYNKACLEQFCRPDLSNAKIQPNEKTNFIYSRVSSRKQLDDLVRQTEYLQQRRPEYASYVSLTDVASGIIKNKSSICFLYWNYSGGVLPPRIGSNQFQEKRFANLTGRLLTRNCRRNCYCP